MQQNRVRNVLKPEKPVHLPERPFSHHTDDSLGIPSVWSSLNRDQTALGRADLLVQRRGVSADEQPTVALHCWETVNSSYFDVQNKKISAHTSS